MANILIVDDEPSNVLLLRRLLENSGYSSIATTTDSRETFRLYECFKPDILLLDIQMPRLDGYGAVREMRQDERLKNLPIVALTASAMHTDRDRVLNAGFTEYITKPVRLGILREAVARLLSGTKDS